MTTTSKKETEVILASKSPRRQLLKKLAIPFSVCPSNINEVYTKHEAPALVVQRLALEKAVAIHQSHSKAVIIGADTLVTHHDTIFGKPADPEDARQTLQTLSRSTHKVVTGVALLNVDDSGHITQKTSFFESTQVTFGALSSDEIERYIQRGRPLDKAGSYGIQDDMAAIFVKHIAGDYLNVVGLPLHALYKKLKTFAPKLF